MKARIIIGIVISIIVAGIAPSLFALEEPLREYLKMDNTWNDSTANANNGTASGGPTFVAGKFNQAGIFDGSDDYVSVADNASLRPSNVTVGAWVYLSPQTGDFKGIISKDDNTHGYGIRTFTYTANTTQVQFRLNGDLGTPGQYTLNNNQWYYLTGTYDGQQTKFYVNGDLKLYNNYTAPIDYSTSYALTLGKLTYVGGFNFSGTIDEAVVFSRALAADEIRYLGSGSGNSVQTFEDTYATYGGTSGNWDTDSLWRAGIEPTTSYNAHIDSGATVTVNASGEMCNNLYMGDVSGESGTLNVNSGGTLTVSGTIIDGGGTSTIAINGGTLSVSGATISVDNFNVGNTGTGAFTLASGKTLTATSETIGNASTGTATFTQSGGTNAVTGLTLNATGTYNLDGGTLDIGASRMSGTGALSIAGGTLDLAHATGTNTAGAVTMSSGSITGAGTLSASSYSFTNSGTVSSPLAGTGSTLTKSGAGSLYLNGANTYTGATTVNGGYLRLSGTIASTSAVTINSGYLYLGNNTTTGSINPAVTITDNGILRFQRTNTMTQGTDFGTIAGTGDVYQSGTGKTVLNANNTYAGGTYINGGVLNIQNDSALGATSGGAWVISGISALELQGARTIGAESLFLQGTGVSNDGALRNIDSNSSWAGAITLQGDSRINSDANTLTLSGGITGAYGLTVGGAGNVTVNSVIGTGTGTLTKDGAGVLTLSGANTYTGLTTVSAGELDLNTTGNNSISGNLTVSGGTAKLMQANQIADTKSLVVSSGIFNIQGFNETVAGVQQTGGTISGSGGTLTSTSAFDMRSGSVSAILGGSVGLNKTTSGIVDLSAANTYSGNTTVSEGTMAFSGSGSIANSPVINVASGASLDARALSGGFSLANGQTLKGTGSVYGDVTISSGATISPGVSPGFTDIYGDFTLDGTYIADIGGLTPGTQHDQIRVHDGNVILSLDSILQIIQWNGFNPTNNNTFVLIDWDDGYSFTNNGIELDSGTWLSGNWSLGPVGSQFNLTYSEGGDRGSAAPEPSSVIVAAIAAIVGAVWRRVRGRARRA